MRKFKSFHDYLEHEIQRPLFVQVGGIVLICCMVIGFAIGCLCLLPFFIVLCITAWCLDKLKLI